MHALAFVLAVWGGWWLSAAESGDSGNRLRSLIAACVLIAAAVAIVMIW